jgi:hypothetical protein
MARVLHGCAIGTNSRRQESLGHASGVRDAMRVVWGATVDGPRTAARQPLSAERMFDALHGRTITVSGRHWELEIYSICDEDGWRWIQLALEGDPRYSLTMRLSRLEGVKHVVMALSGWLAKPSPGRAVLNVA